MWRPDVSDLNAFYAGHQGQLTRRILRRHIRELWPDCSGLRVLGLGYATPYLNLFRDEAERTIAIMPAQQGVVRWPREGANRVALGEDDALPLPDAAFDRILMVHALEGSEQIRALLREVWRILTPGGRLIVIVPNRVGLWARHEKSPFGHGISYTPGQLNRLLKSMTFMPLHWRGALFMPPWRWRMIQRSAMALERLGQRGWPGLAGVLMHEAGKQIYAATADVSLRRRAVRLRARYRLSAPVKTPRLNRTDC